MDVGFWDAFILRLRYGNLIGDGYVDLLQSTLQGLGRVGHVKLRNLLVDAGFDIRPRLTGRSAVPPDHIRWKHWVALAIRYFPALSQHKGLPQKSMPVREVQNRLEKDKKLMQALLFADRDQAYSMLKQFGVLEDWRKSMPEPSTEEDGILRIISYHLQRSEITERQVGNWSMELFDEWASALKDRLQTIPFVWFSLAAGAILNRFVGAEIGVGSDSFNLYIERFKEAGLDWACGQAMGYHNEQKHSFRQASSSASLSLFFAICAATLFVAVSTSVYINAHPLIIFVTGVGALLFIGLFVYSLIRIIVVLTTAYGRASFQLQTLNEIEVMFLSERDL